MRLRGEALRACFQMSTSGVPLTGALVSWCLGVLVLRASGCASFLCPGVTWVGSWGVVRNERRGNMSESYERWCSVVLVSSESYERFLFL